MPFGLVVQPLALQHPEEEPIPVLNFGDSGPIRCCKCRAYLNPFTRFVEQGKKMECNFCNAHTEIPSDYFCYLGPDGRRRDADERPELCNGNKLATK